MRLRSIRDKILLRYFSTQEGYGYRILAILTVVFFLGMSFVALYSPLVPEEILGYKNAQSYEASALGYSSVILILYNAILWPEMKD